MQVITQPTTDEVVSSSITLGANKRLLVNLYKMPLGTVTSGHKVQVLVNGEWEDHMPWPTDEATMVIHGSSTVPLTVRIVKKATTIPVGVAILPSINL